MHTHARALTRAHGTHTRTQTRTYLPGRISIEAMVRQFREGIFETGSSNYVTLCFNLGCAYRYGQGPHTLHRRTHRRARARAHKRRGTHTRPRMCCPPGVPADDKQARTFFKLAAKAGGHKLARALLGAMFRDQALNFHIVIDPSTASIQISAPSFSLKKSTRGLFNQTRGLLSEGLYRNSPTGLRLCWNRESAARYM